MRAGMLLLLALAVPALGCRTHLSLRDNTLLTTETLTDLNYQQVLDNLARFVANPGTMPSLAIVNCHIQWHVETGMARVIEIAPA
jgi:hypothetical protein